MVTKWYNKDTIDRTHGSSPENLKIFLEIIKMSMVVNLWVRELTKLSDKIQLKKKPNFFLKSQTKTDDQIEGHEDLAITMTESGKPASVLLKSQATEKEFSEETVFWLMDRFAPC
ncbi:hypothetical protein L1987_55346 [Smallanthus sonchifolius]|uniref:Uncharacterized protein n=1 Tax=Smallanthus sonchifolius TaxID=185202 RepID=A0ACB9E965_9ASTR|nr:hypothetical protein L1987_55346 [Smallanthus sonchifolius]